MDMMLLGMTAVNPNMTYWERIKNTLGLSFQYFIWKHLLSPIEQIASKHIGRKYDAMVSAFFVLSYSHIARV